MSDRRLARFDVACVLALGAALALVSPARGDHPGAANLDALRTAVGTPASRVDVQAAPAVRRAEPPLLASERAPRVVSNLRLAVHQPENFAAQANDPGAGNPLQGYAGHSCNVPRREDPGIVACSMILSGLRVFDIRDPRNPKGDRLLQRPINDRLILESSNWAMSSPAFAPKRKEIWYSDGFQGFYAVKGTKGVWLDRG